MAIKRPSDTLGAVTDSGFSTAWNWKGDYMSSLQEDGYERFSQFSATPDSTAIYAGPARFTGLSGDTTKLLPIGLTDGLQYNTNIQLARLFEIGSNRSFFTRGKAQPSLTLGKMLADQQNILAALMANSTQPAGVDSFGYESAGGNSPIMMNLDSEYFGSPFGMLLVFKSRGGDGTTRTGKILAGVYLEYCMFDTYNFAVNAQAPVIMENVMVQFDRTVPVSFS